MPREDGRMHEFELSRSVQCPMCQAPPGQPCRGLRGSEGRYSHMARQKLARGQDISNSLQFLKRAPKPTRLHLELEALCQRLYGRSLAYQGLADPATRLDRAVILRDGVASGMYQKDIAKIMGIRKEAISHKLHYYRRVAHRRCTDVVSVLDQEIANLWHGILGQLLADHRNAPSPIDQSLGQQ